MLSYLETQDARMYQIFFLSIFLFAVLFLNEFDSNYILQISITISTCLLVQFVCTYFTNKDYTSLRSAFITSLGLSLLLKTDDMYIVVLASCLAIASKFVLKTNQKHIFNPANFGVIAVIILTQKAWISPGQWGSHLIELFVISSLGFLVIMKVKRLDIALTFIVAYGGMLFLRTYVFLGWPIDSFLHQISNGTLMLFTFFMITDPKTTPNHPTARIVFAVILAGISFYLNVFQQFYTAPLWVLFFMSPFTFIFDMIWKEKSFTWNQNSVQKMEFSLIK